MSDNDPTQFQPVDATLAAPDTVIHPAMVEPPEPKLLRTFIEHTDNVYSVCLSADGRYALSGSWDKTLKLWDVATGECLRTFAGHEHWVSSVCFSADGRHILSGSQDRTIKLWETATGACVRTFNVHSYVNSVCLSADMRYALSGSQDQTLKLWDMATGACLRTFEGHKAGLKASLSTDGKYALSGSDDRTLKLWNVATGECLHTLEGHKSYVFCEFLSLDGQFALSGSDDKTLKLWNAATGKCLRTFKGHTNSVCSVCLSADGRYALSGSRDETIKLWEVATGKCLSTITGHEGAVHSVYLSMDGRFALSGGNDKTLKLWELGLNELAQPAVEKVARPVRAKPTKLQAEQPAPPPGETTMAAPGETIAAAPGENIMAAPGVRPGIVRQPVKAPAAQIWKVGDVILDLYEVSGVLGEGGMGKVYKIHHKGWDTDLAVKSPRLEELEKAGGAENFTRECETWVNLGLHPHIVSCYYVRTLGGIPRVFAEYVEGGSLKQWIDERRLYEGGPQKAMERILDIAIQFAWGLHYAHEAGLVHQDVKPANVMMTPDGMAKVTDFGLAKARGVTGGAAAQPGQSLLVSSGGMTPAYCSPEQAARKPLSRKTDIWSWGLSLLEMFIGEVTWLAGGAAAEALAGYQENGPEDQAIPAMPSSLASLLQQCFCNNPDERPKDMAEIAAILQQIYTQATGQPYTRPAPQASELEGDSRNNQALSLYDLGRMAEAEALWQKNLEANPGHLETTYNLGLLQWRAAKKDDAGLLRDLHAAAVSAGSWRQGWMISQVHLERGDVEQALEILKALPAEAAAQPEAATARRQARELENAGHRLNRTFIGHTSWVFSVCLSGDGHLALSASGAYPFPGSEQGDNTLRLWNVQTGECLRTFIGHSQVVHSAYLSADGLLALSGSSDKTLKLWDASTGALLRTFVEHTDSVYSVCLSHDGRFALSGSNDGDLKFWDIGTGACIRTFAGHKKGVLSVCLSADGRFALSGSSDGAAKLWAAATGLCLNTFEGHANSVNSACLSADMRYALSGSDDNTLKLWELATGKCIRTYTGHTGCVRSVCLSADGRYVLSGSADKTIKFWEAASGKCLMTFEGHTDSVESVFMSADGRYALSGSRDNTLKLWEAATGYLYRAPFAVSRFITSEAATTIEQLLAEAQTAHQRGEYGREMSALRRARTVPGYEHNTDIREAWSRLYLQMRRTTVRAGLLARTFEGHKDLVNSVCLSGDGRYALSGSDDNTLKLWEATTGKCVRTFTGHTDSIISVYLSADGRYALSGGSLNQIRLWEVATGSCLRTFEGQVDFSVTSVYLIADGRFVLSGNGWFNLFGIQSDDAVPREDVTLKLWDSMTGQCLRSFGGHNSRVNALCLSADQQYALSGGGNRSGFFISSDFNQLNLWELATGQCIRTFEGHSGPVTSVSLSADMKYALSGSDDLTLILWEVETGRCTQIFKGHTGPVLSVCLSADGRFALSGSEDMTIKLWDATTGQCLHTFAGHTGMVSSVCWSEDGRYILSGSADSALKLWELDWELEANQPNDWQESVRPYLQNFLTLHTPYANELSQGRKPTQKNITLALTRHGKPRWNEEEFRQLLYTLRCAGYGWLEPENVRQELERLVKEWQGPPLLKKFSSSEPGILPPRLKAKQPEPPAEISITSPEKVVPPLNVKLPVPYLVRSFEPDYMGHVFTGCLSADGRLAILQCLGKNLMLWQMSNFAYVRTFVDLLDTARSVCVSTDERYVLSGSTDKVLKLWELASGKCKRTFKGHTDTVLSVCMTADGRFALSGSTDETIKLWNVASGRCVRTFKGHTAPVISVCLSLDECYALSGSSDKTLKYWEVATGKCLRTFEGHTDYVESVCLSNDGQYALSGSKDKTLILWDVANGDCLRTFQGHTDTVYSVCLNGSGRFALSGSKDGSLRLWEIDTGQCLWNSEAYSNRITNVCLSRDGQYALSWGFGSAVQYWKLDWEIEKIPPSAPKPPDNKGSWLSHLLGKK